MKVTSLIKYTAILIAAVCAGLALAQATPVTILDPRTWFQSQETLFAAVALLSPWLVKALTALGKDWFGTDGRATQWLSLVVAAIVAGVGGYLGLGYLAGAAGFGAALQAAVLTAVAFLVSNGMAKNERQVATAAALRVEEAKRQLE